MATKTAERHAKTPFGMFIGPQLDPKMEQKTNLFVIGLSRQKNHGTIAIDFARKILDRNAQGRELFHPGLECFG
jgi:hypothetical protein